MSIHYDLYENPDKDQTGEKQPLHARVIPSGTYTTKEFIERVSAYQHIPHAQLTGAVEAITSELQNLLSRGYIVEFGDLGFFSVSLKVNHQVMERKDLRAPSVGLKNIHLKAHKTYKRELNAMMELERKASPTRSAQTLSEEECLKRLFHFLKEHPCINRSDYSAITGTNKLQAVRQLNRFIEQGHIKRYGSSRSAVYIMATGNV